MEIPKLPDTLRTEDEVIHSWKGDITQPLVSVRCITYNHAPYIEDAIKGFLIQETDFPIEICIHDDASTDGTREIVESYQKKYPRIIKTILQDENQYSKGNNPGSFINSHFSSKYYASCEGDDFWIDPQKLKIQVMALEDNPHVDMCLHPATRFDYASGERLLIGVYGENYSIISLASIVEKAFGQIPTASTVIRSSAHKELQGFLSSYSESVVGDIYLHFFGAKRGGSLYVDRPMSVYRLHTEGSFGDRYKKNSTLRFKHVTSRVESYLALDKETEGVVSSSLNKSSREFVCSFLKSPKNSYRNRLAVMSKYGYMLKFKEKLWIYPLTTIPYLINIAHFFTKFLKFSVKRCFFKNASLR